MRHVARGVALLLCLGGVATAGQHTFQGLRLDEALRLLQRDGVPIVFSSEIVTASMRVAAEPRATTRRQQLDELLVPHHLKAEAGPGGVLLVVRVRPSAARQTRQPVQPGSQSKDAERPASNSTPRAVSYTDGVTVWGLQDQSGRGASATTFDGRALVAASTSLQSDGLEAIHAMPRVTSADDFRGDFSVRGSPYRQIGIVIDGVATSWLQHAVYGRNDAGSLSMFSSNILDSATLQAGAYPRRYDDTLGAQLELTLKEGSRESTRFAGIAGGTSAAIVGEGPVGSDGRGSWIAGVRNSYRSWPPRRLSTNDVGFAFADTHAKLVYDVSPAQQVSVTALGGRSTLETVDEPLVGPLGNGIDRAGLLTLAWRSTVGSQAIVRQRLFLIGQELASTLNTGELAGRSGNRAVGYRADAMRSLFGGLLDAGGEVSRLSGVRDVIVERPGSPRGAFRASWTTRAAYVGFARATPRGLSFESGARISDASLARQKALAPWIRGAWRFRPAWTITASAGASRQFSELDAAQGPAGSPNLVPERATQVDVGIEQRLSRALWQATLFNRVERDVLQRPDVQPRLVHGVLRDPPSPGQYRNALHGRSRGIDLVVTSERTARLSGWMSYTYAIARQTDVSTRETFWSDVDRRHAVNAAALFRIAERASMALVLRGASGAPIPGYFDVSNGTLLAGSRRNAVRLAPYVRLDARVQRMLFSSRHAVTVFGEMVNVLNRHNEGFAEGIVAPVTGEAAGFSRSLVPRRTFIGVQVDLSR